MVTVLRPGAFDDFFQKLKIVFLQMLIEATIF